MFLISCDHILVKTNESIRNENFYWWLSYRISEASATRSLTARKTEKKNYSLKWWQKETEKTNKKIKWTRTKSLAMLHFSMFFLFAHLVQCLPKGKIFFFFILRSNKCIGFRCRYDTSFSTIDWTLWQHRDNKSFLRTFTSPYHFVMQFNVSFYFILIYSFEYLFRFDSIELSDFIVGMNVEKFRSTDVRNATHKSYCLSIIKLHTRLKWSDMQSYFYFKGFKIMKRDECVNRNKMYFHC